MTATLASGYRWSDNTTGTKTFSCSIGQKDIQVTKGNYNAAYDGSAHGITLTVTEPTSGTTIYYKEGTALTSSNYSTTGSTTKPTYTNVTSAKTIYWYVHTTNANYKDVSGSNTSSPN